MVDPDNHSKLSNPVGRFMVAVGAVMELAETGKILLVQRSNQLDWHPGEWEVGYGRIDQLETLEQGLYREMKEETGLTDFTILGVVRAWHIFRGSEKAENELVGITFHCRTNQENITISDEHQGYAWVTPKEALDLVKVEGIRQDIEAFIRGR